MTKQYTEAKDINKIIAQLKSYDKKDFRFTNHYWERLALRDINHNFLLKIFFEFDKIKLIDEDTLKHGDIGYDLYYELSRNRTLMIGVCPKQKLIFIHGIMRYRRWASAIKK